MKEWTSSFIQFNIWKQILNVRKHAELKNILSRNLSVAKVTFGSQWWKKHNKNYSERGYNGHDMCNYLIHEYNDNISNYQISFICSFELYIFSFCMVTLT